MLLAAAHAWSVAILHIRAHKWASSPLQLAPWQLLLAVPPLAILSWLTEDWGRIRWGGAPALVLAYNGPLPTAFCFRASTDERRRGQRCVSTCIFRSSSLHSIKHKAS